jgi:hypothetical protein
LFVLFSFSKQSPCSAELISTAYQPWNSVFLSQQNSHSRLISRKNSLPNRVNNVSLQKRAPDSMALGGMQTPASKATQLQEEWQPQHI